jgi:hypothetical protein
MPIENARADAVRFLHRDARSPSAGFKVGYDAAPARQRSLSLDGQTHTTRMMLRPVRSFAP